MLTTGIKFVHASCYLALGVVLVIASESAWGQVSSTQPASVEADLVVRLRSDDSTGRLEAFQAICALAPDRARDALLDVVATADDDWAATAGRELLVRHDKDVDPARLGEALLRRSNHFRQVLLETCVTRMGSTSRLIAVDFLQRMLDREGADWDPESCETIGLAALATIAPARPESMKAVQQAALPCPRSRRIWLVIAMAETPEEDLLQLAQTVYRNEENPQLVRVAAATAAAREDRQAEDFVLARMEEFVTRFGREDPSVGLMTNRDDPDAQQAYKRFREEVRLLASLRFLMRDSAESVSLRYATAANRTVRDIALLSVCLRWPERFFEVREESNIEEDELQRYLAVIAAYHGERGKSLIRESSMTLADDIAAKLREGGLSGLFGMAGSVVLGM